MELCRTSNSGYQNKRIIEEILTAKYIQKVSKRNEYLEKFKEYKQAYKTKWQMSVKHNREQIYVDDVNKFIEDMKKYNKLLKEDKISKEKYLEILNKRRKEKIYKIGQTVI